MMTRQRANEIVNATFYRHISNIAEDLKKCDNTETIFNIGIELGKMQNDLETELEKEVGDK